MWISCLSSYSISWWATLLASYHESKFWSWDSAVVRWTRCYHSPFVSPALPASTQVKPHTQLSQHPSAPAPYWSVYFSSLQHHFNLNWPVLPMTWVQGIHAKHDEASRQESLEALPKLFYLKQTLWSVTYAQGILALFLTCHRIKRRSPDLFETALRTAVKSIAWTYHIYILSNTEALFSFILISKMWTIFREWNTISR